MCSECRRKSPPRVALRDGLPEFWHSQFRFADRDLVVEATSGTIDQQGRAFTHAFEIHLEQATLMFDFAVIGGAGRYLCEPMLLDSDGNVEHPKLPGGDPIDAFVNELREVTHSVSDGKTSEILGAILAQDAIRLCEKQSESLAKRQPVTISSIVQSDLDRGDTLNRVRRDLTLISADPMRVRMLQSSMALLIDGYNLLNVTGIFAQAGPERSFIARASRC